ncbi:hypothetical protein D3C85_1834400 [compost metagenome]
MAKGAHDELSLLWRFTVHQMQWEDSHQMAEMPMTKLQWLARADHKARFIDWQRR